jgi:hypothetical protein
MENPFDLHIQDGCVHYKVNDGKLDMFMYTSDSCSDIPEAWLRQFLVGFTDSTGPEVYLNMHFTIDDIVQSMIQNHIGTDGLIHKGGALAIHALQKDMRKALHTLENLTFRGGDDD